MIFEATFYLLTGSVVLIVSFAWMASNGRLKPQITSGGGPSVFVESLNGQLFRFFMTLTLVAIVSGGLSSLLTGDRQMAGFSLAFSLAQAVCLGLWGFWPSVFTVMVSGCLHAVCNVAITLFGGVLDGRVHDFVWSCSVAPFWCAFYTVACGPITGGLFFAGLAFGSIALSQITSSSSVTDILEACRVGVPVQNTLLCFLLALAILRQSQMRMTHSETCFRLLSSQKDAFIKTVSHEIRTPLQGLVSSADLLSLERLPQSARVCVDTISYCTSTLKLLIENVLGSGVSAPRLPLPTEVDVGELEQKLGKYGAALALSKNWLTIRVENRVRVQTLILPETCLLQILLNLIANAIKFSLPESRTVEVTIELSDATTLICSVLDEGKGVREEFRDKLFQAYQRDSGDVEGTGLGLSICRKLAESVGGSVGYRPRSDNKRGSLFYVSFPVQIAGRANNKSPIQQRSNSPRRRRLNETVDRVPKIASEASGDGSLLQVVLIEDNVVNEKILTRMLSSIGCRDVLVFGDAISAIQHMMEIVKSGKYDEKKRLVLMDNTMPHLLGSEACKLWRSMETSCQVRRPARICLTSAGVVRENPSFDCFLLKPIGVVDLQSQLGSM